MPPPGGVTPVDSRDRDLLVHIADAHLAQHVQRPLAASHAGPQADFAAVKLVASGESIVDVDLQAGQRITRLRERAVAVDLQPIVEAEELIAGHQVDAA